MEYKQLEEVNKRLKPIDIKGKDYNTVNQRVLAFRELFPEGSIITEIISIENGTVLMKATVYDGLSRILAVGHAQEKEEASYINKTSYIENCETSAVGRALGFIGIGATEAISSVEEMEAQEKARQKEEEKLKLKALNDLRVMYEKNGGTKFDEWLKAIAPDGMTNEIYAVEMARLKKEITDKAEQTKGKGKA